MKISDIVKFSRRDLCGGIGSPIWAYEAKIKGYVSGCGDFDKVRITRNHDDKRLWDVRVTREGEFKYEVAEWGHGSLKDAQMSILYWCGHKDVYERVA